MAEGMVVEPEGYKARGGIPRGILIGGTIALVVVAVALYLLSTPSAQVKQPDQVAKERLATGEETKGMPQGNPQTIADMEARAERAAAEARRRAGSVEPGEPQARAGTPVPRLAEPGLGGDRAAIGVGAGAGAGGGEAGRPVEAQRAAGNYQGAAGGGSVSASRAPGSGQQSTGDTLREAAEMTARQSPSTVFEDLPRAGVREAIAEGVGAAAGAATREQDAAIARAAGAALPSPMDGLASIASALQGAGGRGAARPAEEADRWAASLDKGGRVPEVLRPNVAAAKHMLVEGTVIPAVTTRQINSDLPGAITARVAVDVYDSQTSQFLLLPKGALLSGRYNNSVSAGQDRLQFAFTRLRMPDGSTYELPGATGSDGAGRAGAEGDVNRHYLRVYGSAVLMGVIADRVVRTTAIPTSTNGSSTLSATGQAMVDIVRGELERFKSTPTTITIKEGTRINVEVVRDMVFPSIYTQRGF